MNEFRCCKVCQISKLISEFSDRPTYRVFTCKKCVWDRRKIQLQSTKWIEEEKRRKNLKGEKICNICKENKSFDLFHINPRSKTGRQSRCKKCSHRFLQESRAKTDYKERFKVYGRRSKLKYFYGIDDKQYDEIVKNQNGACLICGDIPNPKGSNRTNKLHVDHCHRTGKIRGLLCHLCNRGIGLFRERRDLLIKALEYLKIHD